MDGACQFLTREQIVDINYLMYEETGGEFNGDDNLKEPGTLDYILDAVQALVMGYDPYPTVIDKAAAIGWRIITGHVFWDGNKRTGIEVCRVFLRLNGYDMRLDWDIYAMAMHTEGSASVGARTQHPSRTVGYLLRRPATRRAFVAAGAPGCAAGRRAPRAQR